jgi:hypothetical protein
MHTELCLEGGRKTVNRLPSDDPEEQAEVVGVFESEYLSRDCLL